MQLYMTLTQVLHHYGSLGHSEQMGVGAEQPCYVEASDPACNHGNISKKYACHGAGAQ